jgi:hypothetical protein
VWIQLEGRPTRWRNSLKIFQAFQEECAKAGFDLDLGLHLKNLVSFATGQSRFLTVGSLAPPSLEDAWLKCRQGMQFALNFLKNNVGIDSPALLSSPFLIVMLAYFAHVRSYRIDPEECDRLRFWALLANAKGRYSRGSSETILDQDLATLKQGGGAPGLIERLRLQVGRLDIVPQELEARNQRSAIFKTMFLAFRAAGAKDWESNLTIALDHSGAQHRLQFHHIFPKAVLKSSYSSREADDIANLAFIGGRTNRGISKKPPAKYVLSIERAACGAQCIPTDPELLQIESYKAFLAERRMLVAQRLKFADQRCRSSIDARTASAFRVPIVGQWGRQSAARGPRTCRERARAPVVGQTLRAPDFPRKTPAARSRAAWPWLRMLGDAGEHQRRASRHAGAAARHQVRDVRDDLLRPREQVGGCPARRRRRP